MVPVAVYWITVVPLSQAFSICSTTIFGGPNQCQALSGAGVFRAANLTNKVLAPYSSNPTER